MHVAPALRGFESWLVQYRHTWRGTVFSSFVTPALYLLAMGVGVGAIIEPGTAAFLRGADYLEYLAPGLLAAVALQTAAGEGTLPVRAAMRWKMTYQAMVATPLTPTEVLVGHLAFMTLRIVLTCTVFICYMALSGLAPSPSALLALPAAVLTGVACLTPIAALTAGFARDNSITVLLRFVVAPLFLMGGAFFPVSQLPLPVRVVIEVTPVFHGTELCRAVVLGTAEFPAVLLHVLVLVAWTVAGLVLARRNYQRSLVR